VASIKEGGMRVHPSPREARALAEDALGAIEPLARERGVRLRLENRAGDAVVLADRDRVLQVFSNLLGNALKFTPSDGCIEVRLERRERFVWFFLADTGPGIPAE